MRRTALYAKVFCALFLLPNCTKPTDPLASYPGGFDPVRFDGGTLPPLDGVDLGRPLRFNVPPFYADKVAEGAASALEKYLEEEIGVDVQILSPPAYSYSEIADALARGEIDLADLSPYQYALIEQQRVGVVPLAATVAYGASSYGSYLVVRADSDVHSLHDLKTGEKRKIAFVDPLSTSGYVLPANHLRQRGFDLEKDFEVRFAGSHQAVIEQVQNGEVDAGAVSSDLLIGHAGLAGPLRVVAKLGRMPYDVIVARRDLPKPLFVRAQHALFRLSIHDKRARAALRAFSSVDGFMPVPPGHYDEVLALPRRGNDGGGGQAPAPAR